MHLLKIMTQTWLAATITLLVAVPALTQEQIELVGQVQLPLPEHCTHVLKLHQQQEITTRAQNAKLKRQLETMNQATGDRKQKAIVLVLNELIVQRQERQERDSRLQSLLIGHLMEHLEQDNNEATRRCPLMGKVQN